jgi:hypothetical protein
MAISLKKLAASRKRSIVRAHRGMPRRYLGARKLLYHYCVSETNRHILFTLMSYDSRRLDGHWLRARLNEGPACGSPG